MNRRQFLRSVPTRAWVAATTADLLLQGRARADAAEGTTPFVPTEQGKDWLARWERNILGDARNRYCDKETGEELGWLVSPFLEGFYHGYRATRDSKWVALLVDWTDACIRRAVVEPDGFRGWPKGDGGGGESKEYASDSLLGEAMLLRPVVRMAQEIGCAPELKARWGAKAQAWLELAEEVFKKWDARGCWRTVPEGGLWVVPAFGIDRQTGRWSAGFAHRTTAGFSNPANKQNHIARWLLSLHHATGKPVYRERAEGWFKVMRSRMRTRVDGKYYVWNYWDPSGPWDYRPDGAPRHWVGVHPNGGYYAIDVEGIVAAFERGLVFTRSEIDRLIATNRDFMWNQQVAGARFQRIDGGLPDPRWLTSPGTLWTALVPYDSTLRKVLLANHNPAGWGGLSATPWFLALGAGRTVGGVGSLPRPQ
jgi:hypothetical protein